MSDGVTLRFRHSPAEYEYHRSILRRLVESSTGLETVVVRDLRATVDLEFTSVHIPEARRVLKTLGAAAPGRGYIRRLRSEDRFSRINPQPSGNAGAHIWFTGDNVRPPFGDWDGYLSFDLDPLGGRNVYFPHWLQYTDVLGTDMHTPLGRVLTVEELVSPRLVDWTTRPGFVCAFLSNPTPLRLHAIEELGKFGHVEVFGNAARRPVPDKMSAASRFRFVLCLENDAYPGYVTEKPFDAWGAGAVPLWWGIDAANTLNQAAIMDLSGYQSIGEFADDVAVVSRDRDRWESIASQPLLTSPPDLRPALELVRRLVE